MPIDRIIVEITNEPSLKNPGNPGEPVTRTLIYSRETRQWVSADKSGLFTGEIRLINAINEARQKYGDV
jgi:hypothetical protein